MITQNRSRTCSVAINGVEDQPPLTCTGKTSETQTITNPLAADMATWGEWTPAATNTDTSIISITQTRVLPSYCIGNADNPITCDGETSQTRDVTNTLAADTATWGEWSGCY